jgi:hypothetical protein
MRVHSVTRRKMPRSCRLQRRRPIQGKGSRGLPQPMPLGSPTDVERARQGVHTAFTFSELVVKSPQAAVLAQRPTGARADRSANTDTADATAAIHAPGITDASECVVMVMVVVVLLHLLLEHEKLLLLHMMVVMVVEVMMVVVMMIVIVRHVGVE